VVEHTKDIVIRNAKFVVSEAGRQRVLKEKRKNVHAKIVGERFPFSPLIFAYRDKVSYNPYKGANFTISCGEKPLDKAKYVTIIGGEVVKATVGAQNALGDREEVRQSISRDLSQMQADSVIDKYQKLMGGQLNARRFAYEQATGLHNFDDKFLLPRSQQVLKSIGSEGQASTGEKPKPTQSDIDYARAHPEVKVKFKARFGVEP